LESASYRNEKGQLRYTRKTVGYVDPVTGKDVFREDYLQSLLDRVDDADVAHGVLALTSGRYFRQVTF
jgi:hypothetical protein